jgi:hypothetical protein
VNKIGKAPYCSRVVFIRHASTVQTTKTLFTVNRAKNATQEKGETLTCQDTFEEPSAARAHKTETVSMCFIVSEIREEEGEK